MHTFIYTQAHNEILFSHTYNEILPFAATHMYGKALC